MVVLVSLIVAAVMIFSFFSLTVFLTHVLFNGHPRDVSSPLRKLTEQEVAILKRQYPKECFEPDVYQMSGDLTYATTTLRTGSNFGSYDYYQLNGIKVYISYLGSYEIEHALSLKKDNQFLVIKGKRKNYVVDINGVNYFTHSQKWYDWFDCWDKANNGEQVQQKNIRILGQRQPSKKERNALTRSISRYQMQSNYAIGLLIMLPLLFCLMTLNKYGGNQLLLIVIICLLLSIGYCFFLHRRLFPFTIDKINIIEGAIKEDSDYPNSISVGDLCCYVSSPQLYKKIHQQKLNGKTKAVEVTFIGDPYPNYEVVNIEGCGNVINYWQHVVPNFNFAHHLITGFVCLIFAIALYFLCLQPYANQDIWSWSDNIWYLLSNGSGRLPILKINIFCTVLLSLYGLFATGFGLVCLIRNKIWLKRNNIEDQL